MWVFYLDSEFWATEEKEEKYLLYDYQNLIYIYQR